jgi:lysophospholipase
VSAAEGGGAPLGPGSRSFAVVAADGLRLRAAVLPAKGRRRGRLALLHGRTEFLEKYQGVAPEFAARGFDVVSLDWRGQGGSDRMLDDPRRGHARDFAEYQRDLDALLAAPEAAGEGPLLMVAHSMGGAIGLRALAEGRHDFAAAIFSAPMWGLTLSPVVELSARLLGRAAAALGLADRYAPGGGGPEPYVFGAFEDNALTADPDAFAEIARITRAVGDYALGAPNFGWIEAAFREIDALAQTRIPVPALAVLGGDEAVVSPRAIRARAAASGAALLEVAGGRHELFFETPERRAAVWAAIDRFLEETPALSPPEAG